MNVLNVPFKDILIGIKQIFLISNQNFIWNSFPYVNIHLGIFFKLFRIFNLEFKLFILSFVNF